MIANKPAAPIELTETEKDQIVRNVRRWRNEHKSPQSAIRVQSFVAEDEAFNKNYPIILNPVIA